jgi:tetratricopeptide (TPR) repeat protein
MVGDVSRVRIWLEWLVLQLQWTVLFVRESTARAWRQGWFTIGWVLVCGVFLGVAVASSPDQTTRRRQLSDSVRAYGEAHLWKHQQFALLQLMHLNPDDPQLRVDLAKNLEKQGQLERAARILAAMAPEESAGHPDAHYFRARQIQTIGSSRALSPEEERLLQFHLEQAVNSADYAVRAREQLAKVAGRRGDWEQAVAQLKVVAEEFPAANAALAEAYTHLNQLNQAASAAERSLLVYRQRLEANPRDEPARLAAAELLLRLSRPRDALELLEAGLPDDRASLSPPYRSLLSRSCLQLAGVIRPATAAGGANPSPASSESEVSTSPSMAPETPAAFDPERVLQLLQRALEYAPQDPYALEALAKFSLVDSPAAEQARQLLRDVLAAGKAPPVVHLVLGTAAVMRGNLDVAEVHLRQAYELDPALTVAANNLAYLLAQATPPQPERALDLINSAIEKDPQHPEFRDTRGIILLMVSRPQEALVDLELALRAFPQRATLHRRMAEAYTQLGDPEQAQRHEKLATQLDPPSNPTTTSP